MIVLVLVLMTAFSSGANFALLILFFLVQKVAIDLIHWAFKSWCSFLTV